VQIGNTKNEQLLKSALEGLTARQRTIADNVANVDTPEFKATRVSFEKALSQAHGARDNSLPMFKVPGGVAGPGEAVGNVSPTATQETNLGRRNDGNNVDIDTEMLELSDTNIRFNALIQVMSSKMTGLRYVINDGKR
jgi:flagellar basal-body rod protein FlgB